MTLDDVAPSTRSRCWPRRTKKLVIVGDTETTEGLADHVSDADLLVIEATFLQRDAATARLRTFDGHGCRARGAGGVGSSSSRTSRAAIRMRTSWRRAASFANSRIAATSTASRSDDEVPLFRAGPVCWILNRPSTRAAGTRLSQGVWLAWAAASAADRGGPMTFNFETLKATLVLYGLNAVFASASGARMVRLWHRPALRVACADSDASCRRLGHRVSLSLARYAVLAVVGIAVLQLFGIQTASLVAVLGATSLAMDWPCRGRCRTSPPAMLLLFRPFGSAMMSRSREGRQGGTLSLFMTELTTPDNTQILLPNGSVWGSVITTAPILAPAM